MALVGYKDAWALMGIGAGAMASLPQMAGNPLALGAGLALPAAGAAWLTWKKANEWYDRTDTSVRENFVIKSDAVFKESIGETGLRFGFTKDNAFPLDIENGNLQRHTAIIGQSGVGKTTLGMYLLWQQAVRGGGWLFIDAKLDADTRDQLAFMMSLIGRADDFYVLNVDQPFNSNTYNPILKGDADEIASRLLNLIPSSENNPGSDYYRQSANHALTVLTGALKAAKYRYHFADLAIMLQSARAIGELERICPPGPEKMNLQVFLDQFRKKSKEGVQIDVSRIKEVLGGMSGRIAQFAQGKFGQVFNTYTPEIDLTDIVMNNKFLYVMLPTMGKDTAALNLGKLVLSDLRTAVYNVQAVSKTERPWPPFLVFADEMGSYVMPGIARLFEQARSANICMMPAFQSFANLNVVSPDFADIIIQNTWNKVFFKFGSKDSPEMAAEIIGKSKRYIESMTASESQSSSGQTTRTNPTGSDSEGGNLGRSWRESEDFRVTPDQLKSMGMGECVAISGPRMFHLRTPMLNFPKVPKYKAIRHPVKMPEDEKTLDFDVRYKEFLLAASEDFKTIPESEKLQDPSEDKKDD